MPRNLGLAFALGLALAASAPSARAQYAGYGWGGWTSTPQGDYARGLGYFAEGAGQYNLNTAAADSIETDAVTRWNEYLYESQQEINRRAFLREQREKQRTKDGYETHQRKLLTDPDAGDIERGSALNALLDQLGSSKKRTGSKDGSDSPVAAALIKDIPFQSASQAVVLSLGDLTDDSAWPAALTGKEYAADRDAYRKAMNDAIEQSKDGDQVSAETAAAMRESVTRLRARFTKNPPEDKLALSEARDYLQTLSGMARMIQRPVIDKILAELDTVKDTNLGNLLSFMGAYNLRFGPASTPRHREVYAQLYPVLQGYRDRTLGVPKFESEQASADPLPNTVPARRRPPNFFRGVNFDADSSSSTLPDGTPKSIAAPGTDPSTPPPAPKETSPPKDQERTEESTKPKA